MPLVDVNSAPYEELDKVPGIGEAIIPRILAGRPFKDMKDLRDRVDGIGKVREKTLPKYICFGPRSSSRPSESTRPSRQRQGRTVPSQQTRGSTPTPTPKLVDINNASLKELKKLKGIKEVKARRIINARPFLRVDDLLGVKGINQAVLAGFRDRVVIGAYRPEQETCAIQATPPPVPAAMAVSLARRYVDPPDLYDYSDDDETSGDDGYSDEDDEDEDTRRGKIEEADDDQAAVTERQPSGEAGAVFEAYLLQLRDQSEAAAVSYNQWFETQFEPTPPPVPFTIISPLDSRFPVCCAVDRDVRAFVSDTQQPCTERVPSDYRYRVWTPSEPRQQPPAILLASWNVRNVSTNKSVLFLKKIADIINEFDLVALQEVRDEAVLIKLKYLLPAGWAFTVSDPVGQVGGRQEYYAFMYRKRVVEIPTDIWELDTSADADVLRPPFVAHFRSTPRSGLPQPLELTLVNVHVCFGHIRERHREIAAIRRMADDLATQIPSERRNMVILGDFNVPPIEALGGTESPLAALIRPPLSTTVFGSLYDNLWIDSSTLGRPHSGNMKVDACGVYRMDWRYYPLTKDGVRGAAASNRPLESTASTEQVAVERFKCAVELSDHCPVWAAFATATTETTWTP